MGTDNELGIVPVDQMVGGDGDTPGLSQPVTSDEIQDILVSEHPIEERRMRLMELRNDLIARDSGDLGNEFEALIAEIDGAIATLDGPGDIVGTRDALGLDADERQNDELRALDD